QRPATSDQRPATSEQRPATSDQRPATSEQRAASSEQRPATSDQRPATSDQRPANKRLSESATVKSRHDYRRNHRRRPRSPSASHRLRLESLAERAAVRMRLGGAALGLRARAQALPREEARRAARALAALAD